MTAIIRLVKVIGRARQCGDGGMFPFSRLRGQPGRKRGEVSKIEWTEETWNPIRGCSRVSSGCENCYAEGIAARFSGPGQAYEGLAKMTPTGPKWTGAVRFIEGRLHDPLRWKKPRRIFVNSMSDLFHEDVSDEWIDDIFAVMALADYHTFQILTKRPERMRKYFEEKPGECLSECTEARVGGLCQSIAARRGEDTMAPWWDAFFTWPLPNVWLGVSCEDQATADERIPLLLQTPAAIRWVSAEPLLGEIDFEEPQIRGLSAEVDHPEDTILDWVVVGGESGPNCRPMQPVWARDIHYQCIQAQIPFFMKQMGGWPDKRGGLKSIPEDLRVREYPRMGEEKVENTDCDKKRNPKVRKTGES